MSQAEVRLEFDGGHSHWLENELPGFREEAHFEENAQNQRVGSISLRSIRESLTRQPDKIGLLLNALGQELGQETFTSSLDLARFLLKRGDVTRAREKLPEIQAALNLAEKRFRQAQEFLSDSIIQKMILDRSDDPEVKALGQILHDQLQRNNIIEFRARLAEFEQELAST